MKIENKPAKGCPPAQIMRETFRYYEGSRILRELGYYGCGDYWSRRGEKRLTTGYHQTFESALRDPRAQRQMQVLCWKRVNESMQRVARAMAQQLRPAMEAMRRAAQDPAFQRLARISAGADVRNQLLREVM